MEVKTAGIKRATGDNREQLYLMTKMTKFWTNQQG